MAQTRKQRVLGEVRKQRQRRAIATFVVVAILIGVVIGVVYALSHAPGGPGFPFPCLSESVTLHVHPWLRIWIGNTPGNNVSVTIPAAIGILDPQISNGLAGGGSCFEPLHTHDSTGIIHVESGSISDTYTLGDFFKVWAVTPGYSSVNVPGFGARSVVFNSSDIFGFRTDQTHILSLLVDGHNSTAYGSLQIVPLDYCSAALSTTLPCSSTAGGNPSWDGGSYPSGPSHTIVISYKAY